MLIFDYLLYIAAFVMIFSYIPQIIKIIKTKSASDLSFFTWCTWVVFMSIMAYHSYVINDVAFMISQGGQIIMLIIVLSLMVIYKKKNL